MSYDETEAIKNKIISLTKAGSYTITAICTQVGIARATYYNWLESDEFFARDIRRANQVYHHEMLDLADRGLRKLVKGYRYTETTYEFTKLDGQKEKAVPVKRVNKSVGPNASLIQFVLRNLDPDTYPDTQRREVTGADGAPLLPENLPWFDGPAE